MHLLRLGQPVLGSIPNFAGSPIHAGALCRRGLRWLWLDAIEMSQRSVFAITAGGNELAYGFVDLTTAPLLLICLTVCAAVFQEFRVWLTAIGAQR